MRGRVLVFGTFDELHPGHIFFLEQAKRKGETLFVSVARDEHVFELKNKKPKQNEKKRLEAVRQISFVDNADLSDRKLGSFDLITRFNPEIIALGFDQNDLEKTIRTWLKKQTFKIQIKKIKEHKTSNRKFNETDYVARKNLG